MWRYDEWQSHNLGGQLNRLCSDRNGLWGCQIFKEKILEDEEGLIIQKVNACSGLSHLMYASL